jgi:hypothetical protein
VNAAVFWFSPSHGKLNIDFMRTPTYSRPTDKLLPPQEMRLFERLSLYKISVLLPATTSNSCVYHVIITNTLSLTTDRGQHNTDKTEANTSTAKPATKDGQ